jgi:hypothetical protein
MLYGDLLVAREHEGIFEIGGLDSDHDAMDS